MQVRWARHWRVQDAGEHVLSAERCSASSQLRIQVQALPPTPLPSRQQQYTISIIRMATFRPSMNMRVAREGMRRDVTHLQAKKGFAERSEGANILVAY